MSRRGESTGSLTSEWRSRAKLFAPLLGAVHIQGRIPRMKWLFLWKSNPDSCYTSVHYKTVPMQGPKCFLLRFQELGSRHICKKIRQIQTYFRRYNLLLKYAFLPKFVWKMSIFPEKMCFLSKFVWKMSLFLLKIWPCFFFQTCLRNVYISSEKICLNFLKK